MTDQEMPLNPLQQAAAVDLESIPNQIGYAVLNATDGSIVRPISGSLSMDDVMTLHKMLLEMGDILYTDKNGDQELLKRVKVDVGDAGYNMCISKNGFIYIVKKQLIS
mmetsp:Transcript_2124/g.2472  ORF Transcript_2124/g.2472 Transcript_2124/m.2472 type:complete len:108 (+) Transcript_2124:285-608(+)